MNIFKISNILLDVVIVIVSFLKIIVKLQRGEGPA